MIKIVMLSMVLVLSGCAGFKPLEFFNIGTSIEIIDPPLPEQASLRPVTFVNLNKEILQQMLDDPELTEDDFVFIAVSPKGYESLSLNLQELKRIIKHQKEIIIYYRAIPKELKELRDNLEDTR